MRNFSDEMRKSLLLLNSRPLVLLGMIFGAAILIVSVGLALMALAMLLLVGKDPALWVSFLVFSVLLGGSTILALRAILNEVKRQRGK